MKAVGGLVFSLLLAAAMWGQSTPASNAASAPGAAAAPQPDPQAPPSRPAGQAMSPAEINAMHMGQLMRLSDELKAMRTKLDEMKANAAKVKDPALKQQIQLDTELWAMMLSHIQEMNAVNAQTRAFGHFGTGDQVYRQQRQAMRPLPPPPGAPTPATSAAPAATDSKPATPDDHR